MQSTSGLKTIRRTNSAGRKMRVQKRPLNLPETIWERYQASQQIIEKGEVSVRKEKEEKEIVVKKEKRPRILEQLSVKMDDYLIFPNNWNELTQRLNESIEIQKAMYQNLINAKQILVSCSVRSIINTTDEKNVFTHLVVAADTQLEDVIKNIHKQEDALLNCKKIFDKVTIPLQIMNTSFIEDINQGRLPNLVEDKEIELQNEKRKRSFLQAELHKYHDNFSRIKNSYKKSIQEKDKLISHLKLRLCNMKKHFIKTRENHKVEKKINVNPIGNQIHQLKTLMGLAHSMLDNITENQMPTANNTADKKNNIIEAQKQQLEGLINQIKQKDKKIKELLESVEQAKKEKLKAEEKNNKTRKEMDAKIYELTSALDQLKKKHERWLTERYYQKCHSIMLFEKMRQMERDQTKLLNVKKFEYIKKEK